MDSERIEEREPVQRAARPVRGSTTILVIVIATLALVGTGALLYNREKEELPAGKEAALLADYGVVPPVELTERSGRKVSLGDLRGRIWVVDFIFTNCAGTCQMMSSKLSDLQKSLRKAGNVSLVSISVDPKRDSLQQLNAFAEKYSADPDRWLFLTGKDSVVQDLAKNTFMLAVQEGTAPDEQIIHSTRFVLVDAQGHIRGYYNSMENESHQKLLTDIGILMRQGK
jgi:protein SCO1/2